MIRKPMEKRQNDNRRPNRVVHDGGKLFIQVLELGSTFINNNRLEIFIIFVFSELFSETELSSTIASWC